MNAGPGWARHLPWIDGLAALSAGCLVLVARDLLAGLYGVSSAFLLTIAIGNLSYSLIGLTLAKLEPRPASLLTALISANFIWSAICVVLAVRASKGVTFWGYGHLLGEGAFVAALGLLEWRYRRRILEPRASTAEIVGAE